MGNDKCIDLPVTAESIKASPLGGELSDQQCLLLAEACTACGIKDRGYLIEEGQRDDALHVLTKGHMEVVARTGKGDPVGLQIIREGDMLGELGFIDGVEHSASLRAMGNCELIRLDRTSFEGLLDKDPELVYKVMRAIIRTVHRILRNMNIQQVELTNYIAKQNGRY
ncbi:MAG: cyclic nucleotide-binding domain-containing protein [Gammaproteobacteria bacterium]|jgi:CRP-like cAMP-binding protein|nr:cyclic nucleotide-binding domain-containing protein [Gammaproteobacteria bacterium]MDH3935250.1 cyclic nucleotide-binding domain-containing protein [Gammaproteobacteria bacterium]